MGNDEHGPAYPEPTKAPYRCPVCHGDEFRYSQCNHPGCFDGRDRGHPHALLIETYEGPAPHSPSRTTALVGWATVLALLIYMFWPHWG